MRQFPSGGKCDFLLAIPRIRNRIRSVLDTLTMASPVWFVGVLIIAVASFIPRCDAVVCEPVKVPMCRSMPYNMTRMPNRLHHSTQDNAKLSIEQFQALVDTNCSTSLRFFLCTMYVPICAATDFQEGVIPPCRSVCQKARHGCLPIMLRYNVSWPQTLECESLPDYTQGVCIMPDAIITDTSQGEFSWVDWWT